MVSASSIVRAIGGRLRSFFIGQLLVVDLAEHLKEPRVCPNVEAAMI